VAGQYVVGLCGYAQGQGYAWNTHDYGAVTAVVVP
jgi:hypothetical protein